MPTIARASAILLLGVLALALAPDADSLEGVHRGRRDPGRVVQRQLIVKYHDSVDSCVHCLLANKRGFSSAVARGGERLEALHRQHRIASARPLFRLEDEEARIFPELAIVPTAALRNYHRQRLQSAQSAFPKRTRRAAGGASLPDLYHVYVLKLGVGVDPLAAARDFSRNPHVEYAHPDYLVRTSVVPNDPFYHSSGSWGQPYDDLWGLKSDKLDLERAWEITQGEGVVVAVVDTGIDYRHEDIKENVWINPREIAGNGIDDDRNGLVDDVRGWDFTTCTTFGPRGCRSKKDPDDDPMDDNFHGTHVAGTIAAVADNKKGVVGVAPRAKVMAVKGLNKLGQGETSDLAAAMLYAIENGADVLNNSWGCGFCPVVPAHSEVLKAASAMGAVVVFSAGNAARDNRSSSPQNSHRPKPIVVAASAPNDEPTFFTSFGAVVDVAAPGGARHANEKDNILSLRKSGRCPTCRRRSQGKRYLRLQGTSMAAPHAAGLAALVLSNRPGLSPNQVRQILRASSDDLEAPGFDLRTGSGRLNAPRALSIASPLDVEITAPKHLSAPRKQRTTIRGTAAGAELASYQLFASGEGDVDWVPITGVVEKQVRDGVLATVRRSDLEPGWNLLHLVATATSGRRYEDLVSIGHQSRQRRIAKDLEGMAFAPDISGDKVVWTQLIPPIDAFRGHIYLYDLKSKRLTRLTDKPVFRAVPRISGNRVVWHSEVDNDTSLVVTCLYEAATGDCPPEEIADDGAYPVVDGGRVAFWSNHRLAAFDLSTQSRRSLGSSWLIYAAERGVVAWQNSLGGSQRKDVIEVFDWTSEQVQRVVEHRRIASLEMSGRSLVYTTVDDLGRGTLRSYDLDTGSESELLADFPLTRDIDYSGDRVVWAALSEIATFNRATGRRSSAAIHPLAIRAGPAISGDTLVWIDVQHSSEPAGELYFSRVRN